jgi:predicted nucleic acid-binding protein
MRPAPHPAVLAWIAAQPRATLHATRIAQAEILYGLSLLSAGQRRDALAAAAEAVFAEDLAGRVLPFGGAAAAHYATLVAQCRHAGNPIEAFDALIAATALAAGVDTLATRDVDGFAGCGLAIINPWEAVA